MRNERILKLLMQESKCTTRENHNDILIRKYITNIILVRNYSNQFVHLLKHIATIFVKH